MPPICPATLRQLDDLGGRRERARHVEEARAQAERAVFHALPHQPRASARARRRSPADWRSPTTVAADRPLTDEAREIRRDARRRRACSRNGRSGTRRAAVRPLDERRHALPHVVVGGRHLEDAAPRMRVDVDETGRHDQAARRRSTRAAGSVIERGDAGDGVPRDRDVGAIPRAAGAVDDAAVAKDEIVGGRLGAPLAHESTAGPRVRHGASEGAITAGT